MDFQDDLDHCQTLVRLAAAFSLAVLRFSNNKRCLIRSGSTFSRLVSLTVFLSLFPLLQLIGFFIFSTFLHLFTPETFPHFPLDSVLFHRISSNSVCRLNEATIAKIQIFGTDYQEKLRERIDPANLPECLGGTCNCPGGRPVIFGSIDR